MNAYDLLIESAKKGHGRTLGKDQVVWVLQLIQNMDAALVQFQAETEGIVEGEVIDDEQVLEGQGQLSEVAGVDSSESEEEE